MIFTSYAQNFEDVMLWRALKHIEKGLYVDVGAQDPVVDSVSKAFYERGWRGIHIEPVPQYAELLRRDRPDETVLEVALGDAEGTLELNVIPDTGLSTAIDAYAQQHQADRGYELTRIQVPMLTLKSALKLVTGKDVHWLKIDVEGFEENVLKGWDSQTLRPWLIVVEASVPGSPETVYASWEPILTGAHYRFVYFDGLNRFYVSEEHAELKEAFFSPPNVFDCVQLSGLATSGFCSGVIASHQAKEKDLVAQAENFAAELRLSTERNSRLETQGQWLQNGWDRANQRLEELSKHIGTLEANFEWQRQRNSKLEQDVELDRLRKNKLEGDLELGRLRMNKLEGDLESERQRNDKLEGDLELERQRSSNLEGDNEPEHDRVVSLVRDLHDPRDDVSQLKLRTESLQKECDAAKSKIDELKQLAHHWRGVADQFNQELQGVYASKAWKVTWPLRKTMHATRWLLALLAWVVEWSVHKTKSIAKLLVASIIGKILLNPGLKSRALVVLAKHPGLKQRLRQFAMRSGLAVGYTESLFSRHLLNANTHSFNSDSALEFTKNLPSRVARIYAELRRAAEASKR